MQAFGYIRYSSDDQAKGNSVDRQRENIEAYAQRAGLTVVQTLVDRGLSASKGHHIADDAELGKFLSDADKGKYRGFSLIVERLDRLSRLGILDTGKLLDRIISAGVTVHVSEENRVISDLNDMTQAMLNVVRSFADREYSKKLSERISRANAKRREKQTAGAIITNKNCPCWLEVRDGKFVEVTEASGSGRTMRVAGSTVRQMFNLASLGIGADNIAKQLGDKIPSRSWVAKTLCNRAALGEFKPKGCDTIPNYFPAVVTMTEWESARQSIKTRSKLGCGNRRNSYSAENLFSGMVYHLEGEESEVSMNFQKVQRGVYLVESKDSRNKVTGELTPISRRQKRISYKKFEDAMLRYLTQEDWSAVASQAESNELKAAKADFETVLREIDAANGKLAKTREALDGADDADTMRILAGKIAKDEAALVTLNSRRDALQADIRTATTTCNALYQPEVLLELIKQASPESNEIRLKLRAEIRKRIEKVSILIGPFKTAEGETVGNGTLMLHVRFVNGSVRIQQVSLDTGASRAMQVSPA
jgi:DNA invertase Pin-like site-specific DNA recombinase